MPLPVTAAGGGDSERIFDDSSELTGTPRVTSGCIAVFVDLDGRAAPVNAIRDLHERLGAPLGDIVALKSKAPVTVDRTNCALIGRELIQQLGRIQSYFPDSSGITLFLALPAPVAFMVGRALNPTIVRNVLLTNFHVDRYDAACTLPYAGTDQISLPSDPKTVAARADVETRLKKNVADLTSTLSPDDLPASIDSALRVSLMERLRGLNVEPSSGMEFGLTITSGKLVFGAGLLEALRGKDELVSGRFVQLLVLHELIHTEQGLKSSNYNDVGRAGVVLEHVDYAADTFALLTAMARAFRLSGADASAKDVAQPWFEAAIFGIEVFDQLKDPVTIHDLPERRLRRYLTWHLQLQRALTIRQRSDLDQILNVPIAAELAPLAGKMSPRYDKIVTDTLPETSFFCAIDGRLINT